VCTTQLSPILKYKYATSYNKWSVTSFKGGSMTRQHRNINSESEWGEALPKGWYHIRIAKVRDTEEDGSPLLSKESKNPIAEIQLKVQEEPHVGVVIMDYPSLQEGKMAKMKAYYTKTGQGILEDGSDDPELLLDAECYVLVEHEIYQGSTRMKIPPYGIRPLSEGKPRS
jgi:hypothetical protein